MRGAPRAEIGFRMNAVLNSPTEFAPSPAEAEQLKRTFDLSYHIPYCAKAAKEVGFVGKRVVEIGGNLPPAFVRDQLGAAQWTAVEELSYWRLIDQAEHRAESALNLSYTKHLAEAQAADIEAHEYLLLDGAFENAPDALGGQFDVAFSIACFEHLSRLPKVLSRTYHLLKPGGKLFAMFSPIWSSWDGHHLPEITDSRGQKFYFGKNNPIPPWGHLVLSPSEMFEYLLSKTDPTAAEEMVYYIYHAPNINRLFAEDYIRYVKLSPLKIVAFAETFHRPVPAKLQAELEYFHPGKKRFANNGFLAVLQRE
jgi:SAM-dependent methyltransferase